LTGSTDPKEREQVSFNPEMAHGETDFRIPVKNEKGDVIGERDPPNVVNIKKMGEVEPHRLEGNDGVEQVFTPYNWACSATLTTEALAKMFAVVNHGVSPVKQDVRHLPEEIADYLSKGLALHGFYNESGFMLTHNDAWGKSGVDGGIVTFSMPNPDMLIVAHEPGLGRKGNATEPMKMVGLLNKNQLVFPPLDAKIPDRDPRKFLAAVDALPTPQEQLDVALRAQLSDEDYEAVADIVRNDKTEVAKLAKDRIKFNDPDRQIKFQFKPWKSDSQMFDPADPGKFDLEEGVKADKTKVQYKKPKPHYTAVGTDGVERQYFLIKDSRNYLSKVIVKRTDGEIDDIRPQVTDPIMRARYHLDNPELWPAEKPAAKEKPVAKDDDAGVGSSKSRRAGGFGSSLFGMLPSSSAKAKTKTKAGTDVGTKPVVTKRAEKKPAPETPAIKKSEDDVPVRLATPVIAEDDLTMDIDFSKMTFNEKGEASKP